MCLTPGPGLGTSIEACPRPSSRPSGAKASSKSDERWSAPGEGTNFSDNAADAESYTNFGSTDPRKTKKPNYVVEVKKDDSFKRWRDGYWKSPEVPKTKITRAWKMVGEDGAVVAYPTSI
jgi:hypothetical protein